MNSWISVNEKLPENEETVLAYCPGNTFFARYNNSSKIWNRVPKDNIFPQAVTHWMPLPKPPAK